MVQYESWADRLIREAQERGEFDNLPGAGKPLQLDDDPDWWIKAKFARENLEPLLPTSLALRREVDQLPEALAKVRTEAEAEAIVEDLKRRIRESHARPDPGPRIVVGTVKADEALTRWREHRKLGRG